MTSKELTYQDIVKLRKQMQENNRNFYEQPIVITYQQAIQIENECLALQQENEKLKKAIEILKKYYKFKLFPPAMDNIPEISISTDWEHYISQQEYELLKEVINNE